MAFIAAATVAASAILAACSSFGGEVTPEVPDSAPALDGPAAADASAIDGIADGDAAPFCQSLIPAPTFCRDFDDNKPANYDFTEWEGMTLVDTSTSVSAPGSMRAVLGTAQPATLTRTFAGFAPRAMHRVALKVRFGAPGGANTPTAARIVKISTHNAADCIFQIRASTGANGLLWRVETQATVGSERPGVGMVLPRYPVTGEWTSVVFTLEKGLDVVTMAVDVDGIVSLPETPTTCPDLASSAPEFFIGLDTVGTGEANFDDVVFDGN